MNIVVWRIASSCVFAVLLSVKFQATNGIRVCGSRLADTLEMACSDRGGFHTPVRRSVKPLQLTKRDIVYLMKSKSRPYQGKLPSVQKPPPMEIEEVESDAAMDRRNNQEPYFINIPGVVDECCRRSCTYDTLISYCASSGSSTTAPSALTDFINKVGYHSSEETAESSQASELKDETGDEDSNLEALKLEGVQSDQPGNAVSLAKNVETHLGAVNGEITSHRPLSGLHSRVGQQRRPNMGVYSRNRPFFLVVSSRFHGLNNYPSLAQ